MPVPRRALAFGAGLIASTLALTGCSAAQETAPSAQVDVSSCDPSGVTISAQYASQGQAAAELGKETLEKKKAGKCTCGEKDTRCKTMCGTLLGPGAKDFK